MSSLPNDAEGIPPRGSPWSSWSRIRSAIDSWSIGWGRWSIAGAAMAAPSLTRGVTRTVTWTGRGEDGRLQEQGQVVGLQDHGVEQDQPAQQTQVAALIPL